MVNPVGVFSNVGPMTNVVPPQGAPAGPVEHSIGRISTVTVTEGRPSDVFWGSSMVRMRVWSVRAPETSSAGVVSLFSPLTTAWGPVTATVAGSTLTLVIM